MKYLGRLSFILAGLASLAFAEKPVATASSSASFELDGSLVNTGGVPSWPLMAGDTVVAQSSPIAISLRDGSRIVLAPNSHLRLASSSDAVSANLVTGSMQYTIAPGSGLRILKSSVPMVGTSGSIAVGPSGAFLGTPRSFVAQPMALSKFK